VYWAFLLKTRNIRFGENPRSGNAGRWKRLLVGGLFLDIAEDDGEVMFSRKITIWIFRPRSSKKPRN